MIEYIAVIIGLLSAYLVVRYRKDIAAFIRDRGLTRVTNSALDIAELTVIGLAASDKAEGREDDIAFALGAIDSARAYLDEAKELDPAVVAALRAKVEATVAELLKKVN